MVEHLHTTRSAAAAGQPDPRPARSQRPRVPLHPPRPIGRTRLAEAAV